MRGWKRAALAGCAAAVLLTGACGQAAGPEQPPLYTYQKQAESGLLFAGGDARTDDFLNDFLSRHLRSGDASVGALRLGEGGSAWKEWEAKSLMWFDAEASAYAGKSLLKEWLTGIRQDALGYIWMDDGGEPDSWGQGWQFPTYRESAGRAAGFEFAADAEGWTAYPEGAAEEGTLYAQAVNERRLTFLSPAFSSDAFHSPFLNLGLTIEPDDGRAPDEAIADVKVYFRRAGDADFDESRCVSYRTFSTAAGQPLSRLDTLYFPMYLHPVWGSEEGKTIVGLKIVVEAEEGYTGRVGLRHARCDYDARHLNNNAVYLCAAAEVVRYSQDGELLGRILAKCRRAMLFLLEHCKGKEGLVDTSYFVGHDGLHAPGHGIGDGYWDIVAMPSVNLYTNLNFYRALGAMVELERWAEALNLTGSVGSVRGPRLDETLTYRHNAPSLEALQERVAARMRETFWDQGKGRFFLGTLPDGERVDYGFLSFNEEAVAAGLCSAEEERAILDWASGKKTFPDEDSTGADLYRFEFAPRFSTIENETQYYWRWSGVGRDFGSQVQDGGSALHLAYYDICAYARADGPETAYSRLQQIRAWYEKVRAAGGGGYDFYRAYYAGGDVRLQGGGTSGAIGLDSEFLEAALLYAAVPECFFGLGSREWNVLEVRPALPAALEHWKLENLTFGGLTYDLTVGADWVQINALRGDPQGMRLRVRLKKPAGTFQVLLRGEPVAYREVGDELEITVPMQNGRVRVMPK